MNVAAVMTRDVVRFKLDTPVSEIAKSLVEHGISGAPVVDPQGRPVGMVTMTDLVARNAHLHFPRYLKFLDSVIFLERTDTYQEEVRKALATTAAELMTPNPRSVTPETDVADVATMLFEQHMNAVPVVRDGRLVGIVTRYDIVRLMARDES